MVSEWKSQNEIRFYELSSHQDWQPTVVLKIRGKDPDSYSKWIKGFRQNLKGNRGGLTMEIRNMSERFFQKKSYRTNLKSKPYRVPTDLIRNCEDRKK